MSRPTQKEGIESPSSAKIFPALSHQPLTRTAATMPVGRPITSENTIATVARRSEAGRRERESSRTAVREENEWAKWPRARGAVKLPYWTGGGWGGPQRRRDAAGAPRGPPRPPGGGGPGAGAWAE